MIKIIPVFFLLVSSIFIACNGQKKATAVPTATLTNTYWKLAEMDGKPLQTPENTKEVHIKFISDGNKLQGHAGCNGLGGNYKLSGKNKIKMRAITTQMYCDRMPVENYLTSAITNADNFKIEGETLYLMQGEKPLAKFVSVYF